MKALVVASAIAVSQVSIEEVNACFKRELDTCSDRVCEMSTDDNAIIVNQVWKNVIDCLENKK